MFLNSPRDRRRNVRQFVAGDYQRSQPANLADDGQLLRMLTKDIINLLNRDLSATMKNPAISIDKMIFAAFCDLCGSFGEIDR